MSFQHVRDVASPAAADSTPFAHRAAGEPDWSAAGFIADESGGYGYLAGPGRVVSVLVEARNAADDPVDASGETIGVALVVTGTVPGKTGSPRKIFRRLEAATLELGQLGVEVDLPGWATRVYPVITTALSAVPASAAKISIFVGAW